MKNAKTTEVNLIRSRALTVLFSMAISALLLLPLFSSAKERDKSSKKGKVEMQPLNKDYHATVKLIDMQDGKYTLTVESTDGITVYYDALLKSPEQFSKVFDFSRLKDGEYTLRVKSNDEEIERNFEISKGKVNVTNEEVAVPEFNIVGQRAHLMLPNDENNYYSIQVISPLGEELYSTRVNDETNKKTFDFSEVKAGKYQIVVSSDNGDFAFDFLNQR
ncbi:MAG: hypothetical protein WCX31_06265 [Salinivirgaceae bacterium]|jgi:hypothetical protein